MCARVDASGVSDLGRQENGVAAAAETGASGQEAGPPSTGRQEASGPPSRTESAPSPMRADVAGEVEESGGYGETGAGKDLRPRIPALAGNARGRRLAKPGDLNKGPSELTPAQRLLILDTWRRSGLPANDSAQLAASRAATRSRADLAVLPSASPSQPHHSRLLAVQACRAGRRTSSTSFYAIPSHHFGEDDTCLAAPTVSWP